jgi:hypothetical protein
MIPYLNMDITFKKNGLIVILNRAERSEESQ